MSVAHQWKLDTDRKIVSQLIIEYRALRDEEANIRKWIDDAGRELAKKETAFDQVSDERKGVLELIKKMHPGWSEHNIVKILDNDDVQKHDQLEGEPQCEGGPS